VVIGLGAATSLTVASALGGTDGAPRIFLAATVCSALAALLVTPEALADGDAPVR
jgi:hypothetical protein